MTHTPHERPEVWRDLVEDFLEMACFLTPEEQVLLLQALEEDQVTAETIHVYPGFLIDGRMVMISEEHEVEELWLYNPKAGMIRKQAMRRKIGTETEV